MPAQPAEPDASVRLHPLVYLDEDGEVVVGRRDTDSYGVFPPDGAELLRRLGSGVPAGEAARWYARTYGEPVDMAEFLGTIEELGFVADEGAPAGPVTAPRWQRLGRWLFSPLAWICYLLLAVAAGAVMVVHPQLAPRTSELFFTPYLTVLALTELIGQIPLVLLHESFHALAGRRLGVHSTLRIGRRLYFVVFETNLDGLVTVPRSKRYLPMLAGMLCDLLIVSIFTLVAVATLRPDGSVSVIGAVCLALSFGTLLRVVWQFYFYLRTDLYCVVATVLGCNDLHTAARRILRNRFRRLLGRVPLDESGLHPRDRAVGRWYSWLVLAGYTFSIGTLVFVGLPALLTALAIGVESISSGWQRFADAALFFTLNVVELLIAGFLALRSRRRRKAAPTHLAT